MRVAIYATVVLAVVGAGCGRQPRTVKLAGTVTLDNKPLSEGMIYFHPADKEGASQVSAPIVDGKYTAPVVPAGSYRVSFSNEAVVAPTGPVSSTFGTPDPGPNKKNPIPEKYRKPSLPADASADNPNLNFELHSN